MSDYMLWLRTLEDAEEQYELDGRTPPAGHPDEWLQDMERKEVLQRYYDCEIWPRPVTRESDDWDELDDDDLDVAA